MNNLIKRVKLRLAHAMEMPFIHAIQDDPLDDMHHLQYADWLQENGDPRHEIIRQHIARGKMAGRYVGPPEDVGAFEWNWGKDTHAPVGVFPNQEYMAFTPHIKKDAVRVLWNPDRSSVQPMYTGVFTKEKAKEFTDYAGIPSEYVGIPSTPTSDNKSQQMQRSQSYLQLARQTLGIPIQLGPVTDAWPKFQPVAPTSETQHPQVQHTGNTPVELWPSHNPPQPRQAVLFPSDVRQPLPPSIINTEWFKQNQKKIPREWFKNLTNPPGSEALRGIGTPSSSSEPTPTPTPTPSSSSGFRGDSQGDFLHPDILYMGRYGRPEETFAAYDPYHVYRDRGRRTHREILEDLHTSTDRGGLPTDVDIPRTRDRAVKDNWVLGRTGDYKGQRVHSFWNQPDQETIVKDYVAEEMKNGNIKPDDLISFSGNADGMIAAEYFADYTVPEEIKQTRKFTPQELAQAHVDPVLKAQILGQEAKSKKHKIQEAMEKAGLILPGHRWWGPLTEQRPGNPIRFDKDSNTTKQGEYAATHSTIHRLFGHDSEAIPAWQSVNNILSHDSNPLDHAANTSLLVANWLHHKKPKDEYTIRRFSTKILGDSPHHNDIIKTLRGEEFQLPHISSPLDPYLDRHKHFPDFDDMAKQSSTFRDLTSPPDAPKKSELAKLLLKSATSPADKLREMDRTIQSIPQHHLAYRQAIDDAAKKLNWTPHQIQESAWTLLAGLHAANTLGTDPNVIRKAMTNDTSSKGWQNHESAMFPGLVDTYRRNRIDPFAIRRLAARAKNNAAQSSRPGIIPIRNEASIGYAPARSSAPSYRNYNGPLRRHLIQTLVREGLFDPTTNKFKASRLGKALQLAKLRLAASYDAPLDFGPAQQRVESSNQAPFVEALRTALANAGIAAHQISPALHDIAGQVRASVIAMGTFRDPRAPQTGAAWAGMIGRQPGMLAFTSHPDGPDAIYHFHHQNADAVRQALDQAGVASRILVPDKTHYSVYLYDKGQKLRPQIASALVNLGVTANEWHGEGTKVGGNVDDMGREQYRAEINKSEQQGTKPQPAQQLARRLVNSIRLRKLGPHIEPIQLDDNAPTPQQTITNKVLPDWVPREKPGKEETTGFIANPDNLSWISGLKYTPERGSEMVVRKGGKSYTYPGLSLAYFRRWVQAKSKGKWWHRNIGDVMRK